MPTFVDDSGCMPKPKLALSSDLEVSLALDCDRLTDKFRKELIALLAKYIELPPLMITDEVIPLSDS